MADLSGRLPSETDSAQRFVASAPKAPSIFESLADFGSQVASVADKAWTSLDKNAAKRNAGAELGAKNDAVKRIASGIFADPSVAPQPNIPPESQGAYDSSKPLAAQAANTQAAAAQGKVDLGMAQAKSLAVFRQALAANPGHEFAVWTAFKEAGVNNMMMQQYDNANHAIQSEQDSEHANMAKLESDAINKYGYTNLYSMDPATKAKTLASVGLLNAQETDLDLRTKQASLVMQNHQLTAEEATQVQKTTSQGLVASATSYMTSSFGNLSKTMINLLGDPTLQNQPGRLEALQSHLMNVALPALDTQFQLKIAQVLPNLTPEDRSLLQDSFKTQRQALVDMISGPQSVVEMNKRVLENISTQTNIDFGKAAPTLMKVQKIIGPQALGVLLSPAVTGNKPLMDMLTKELSGAITDPSKVPSFTEFVQSLNGSIDASTWNPEKIRAAAPAAIASMNALAHNDPATNGTDKQGHLALVNSVKQTAGIAVDVVPQWGFQNVLTQGKALNVRGVTTALFNTSANADDRFQAIRSWIPATTRTYQTLANMDAGDKYYKVQMDPHTLQWQAVWNGTKIQPSGLDYSANPGIGLKFGQPTVGLIKPTPNSQTLEQVSTLNHMLHNLSDSASKGYDDSFGDKRIPYNEARKFFATGEVPASVQNATSKQKNGKTPEQNVDDAIGHMLDFVNKLPNPTATPTGKAHEIGPSPLAPAIGTSATKYNVPTNIAAALFHTETSGGRNVHDSSKGAVGPGQIMPATAAGYGVSDVHSLKPEENVDLALHILSDNYKRTGSWEDALAMYHSGHDLKTATRRGLNDGHMKTSDYVATTMASASSISPDNLARYGYVRR